MFFPKYLQLHPREVGAAASFREVRREIETVVQESVQRFWEYSFRGWDNARLVVQIGGESEDAVEVARRHGLFVVDGSRFRLALLSDRAERRKVLVHLRHSTRRLGETTDSPLIDKLHRAMLFWQEENRPELVSYLSQQELLDYEPFWKLVQALFEVLPRDGEDRKILSALLGERDIFQIEARRLEARKDMLF